MFNDIFIFIAIVETGSLINAAKKLGMSQATVSRRLQALEDELGFKLIMRSTRSFELTDIGKELYDGVKDQQEHLNNFVSNLSTNMKNTVGKLRVSLPTVLSYDVISPYLPEFLQNHPGVTLDICYQNRNIDILKERLDLVIVSYRPLQQTLKIRHLLKVYIQLYCTPEYVKKYGMPESLEEVKNHLCSGFLNNELQPIKEFDLYNLETGKIQLGKSSSRIYHNNALHNKPAILSNHMIGAGWDMLFKKELETGKIIKVLPNYTLSEISFYLVRIQEHNNKLIETFIDFIDECFTRVNE